MSAVSQALYLPTKSRSVAEQFNSVFGLDDNTVRLLSHAKRFLERWTADEKFRETILDGALSLKDAQEICGCAIDVHTLLPVFHPDYTTYRSGATILDWPLTYLWNQQMKGAIQVRDSIVIHGGSNGLTPQFDLWRARNINRAALQLDVAAIGITHPPVAFELSSGCSVGCWFCGISAEKFKGHATLANGGEAEWRKTVEAVKAVVGDGIQCGFCYWATDPLDNPEYVEFLEIFEDVTGVIPQTTTAIPLRNVELTKRVLMEWQKRKTTPNRFSVMTKRQLLEIHEKFTPEELYGVEIVLQTGKDLAVTKFSAGRNFTQPAKKEASNDGTIACVTGFLINIVEKTVKLISPTMPSENCPNGYIIFASRQYTDAEDLKKSLGDIIAKDMKTNMVGNKTLRIVEGGDFDFDRNANGIKFRKMEISNDFIGLIGPQLSDGQHTPMSLVNICRERGMPAIRAIAELEKLWQEGVTDQ